MWWRVARIRVRARERMQGQRLESVTAAVNSGSVQGQPSEAAIRCRAVGKAPPGWFMAISNRWPADVKDKLGAGHP